jgi:hypothetical protein
MSGRLSANGLFEPEDRLAVPPHPELESRVVVVERRLLDEDHEDRVRPDLPIDVRLRDRHEAQGEEHAQRGREQPARSCPETHDPEHRPTVAISRGRRQATEVLSRSWSALR